MSAPRITVSRCKGKKSVAQQAILATGTEMAISKQADGEEKTLSRDKHSARITGLSEPPFTLQRSGYDSPVARLHA